jgi:hypothetical protein
MRLLWKIVTATLTFGYCGFGLVNLYGFVQFPQPPILPFSPLLLFVFSAMSIGLLIFYCVHLAENEYVSRFSRVLWFIQFFILGFIAFPIYWISFIMRSEPGAEED